MTSARAPPQAPRQRDRESWCGGRDLNPHALTGHQALNLARLPFPPPPQGASGQCIEASLGRPLPDQPHGDRQVETSPCPVLRQHLRRAASSGEGEAAAVTEREQPPPGKGAQRPGELSVVAGQRLNDDASGGNKLVDQARVDTYLDELADDLSEVGSPRGAPTKAPVTRSPGLSWIRARTAEASRTVTQPPPQRDPRSRAHRPGSDQRECSRRAAEARSQPARP